jgi:hypothetical protein
LTIKQIIKEGGMFLRDGVRTKEEVAQKEDEDKGVWKVQEGL